jgi:hypothetical protein
MENWRQKKWLEFHRSQTRISNPSTEIPYQERCMGEDLTWMQPDDEYVIPSSAPKPDDESKRSDVPIAQLFQAADICVELLDFDPDADRNFHIYKTAKRKFNQSPWGELTFTATKRRDHDKTTIEIITRDLVEKNGRWDLEQTFNATIIPTASFLDIYGEGNQFTYGETKSQDITNDESLANKTIKMIEFYSQQMLILTQ